MVLASISKGISSKCTLRNVIDHHSTDKIIANGKKRFYSVIGIKFLKNFIVISAVALLFVENRQCYPMHQTSSILQNMYTQKYNFAFFIEVLTELIDLRWLH